MSADKDLISVQQARDLVEAAHRAQAEIARFDQTKIDRICEAMAKATLRESPRIAALAVEETGYGIPEDKQEKNRFAAEDVWNYFKNLRTVGVVSETKDVVEIASPRGVVAGIIPSTNPTSTAIFKILIAIKSRNSIVMSPHPSAARCINETAKVMRELHQRDRESHARGGDKRRIAGLRDWLYDDRDHRRHRGVDEAQANGGHSRHGRDRSGARGVFFRQACIWRWSRQRAGVD